MTTSAAILARPRVKNFKNENQPQHFFLERLNGNEKIVSDPKTRLKKTFQMNQAKFNLSKYHLLTFSTKPLSSGTFKL